MCWLAACGLAVGAGLGFLLLVMVAVTSAGRLAACAVLAAGAAPVLLTQAWVERGRRWLQGGVVCVVVSLGLTGELVRRAPRGDEGPGAKLSSAHLGSVHFRRYSPGNLVPEVDQLLACFTVMALVDPLFTWRQSVELKEWTAQLYAELDQDPEFARPGSAMPLVYDELLGWSPSIGHCFVYVPPGVDRAKPAPLLVFFHGSGGNFKGYLRVLAGVADRLGIVVAAPSYGMGNWQLPETEEAFETALRAAGRVASIAPDSIHAAGLSNGGLGVSQLASVRGAALRSLVLISPVLDLERLRSPDFGRQCGDRPVLVMTGQEDDRIPLAYVERGVAELAAAGAIPTLVVVPGANHFLLFSHRERAVATLVDWFARYGVGGPP
ncbi:MAG: prolyl oligopeptidase family serine peptidase [Opitutaceae bacterium]|nr:prolyl oligopeptidase family serine peptidase [Opitutaceae bacterium]